jgi:hypothetical protein
MEALDFAAETVFRTEVRKWLAENTAGFAGSVQAVGVSNGPLLIGLSMVGPP